MQIRHIDTGDLNERSGLPNGHLNNILKRPSIRVDEATVKALAKALSTYGPAVNWEWLAFGSGNQPSDVETHKDTPTLSIVSPSDDPAPHPSWDHLLPVAKRISVETPEWAWRAAVETECPGGVGQASAALLAAVAEAVARYGRPPSLRAHV